MRRTPLLIAVVDDDVSVCRAVGRVLRASGFDVATFTDGPAFLRFIERRRCDCALLDLRMPGMSGFELQSQLRQKPEPLPVVMFTARDTPELHQRAMDAGAVAFLRKPADQQELLDAILAGIGI